MEPTVQCQRCQCWKRAEVAGRKSERGHCAQFCKWTYATDECPDGRELAKAKERT